MSRIAIAIACLASSLATACVANGDDTVDPPADQLVIPQQGQWYYSEVTKISSNCTAGDDGVSGGFAILAPSAAGFTVDDGDTPEFNCTLSGGSFNCPNRAAASDDLHPQYDAVLTAHAAAKGTFNTATHGSGTQEATVDCAGSACALAGTWPCSFKVSFQISAN